jgi:hypothetical protein
MAENCGTCKYFDGVSSGECLRYPPLRDDTVSFTRFPRVYTYNWCGEYKERPAKDA